MLRWNLDALLRHKEEQQNNTGHKMLFAQIDRHHVLHILNKIAGSVNGRRKYA